MGPSFILCCAAALAAAPLLCAAPSDAPAADKAASPPLELRPNDRVVILGNATADALFQDGHLETLLHLRFPSHRLLVRNLAFPGDTARGLGASTARDQWLRQTAPDVLLIFYGGAESFSGEAGLTAYRASLKSLLQKVAGLERPGKPPLQIGLFGPAAVNPTHEPQTASSLNASRKMYSDATAAIAAEAGVSFVDLFSLTLDLFVTDPQRSALLPSRWGAPAAALQTATGLLTEEAHRLLAPKIFRALLGEPPPGLPEESPSSAVPGNGLRAAVVARHAEWQAAYRPAAGTPPPADWSLLQPLFARRDAALMALAAGEQPLSEEKPASPSDPTDRQSGEPQFKLGAGFKVQVFADSNRFAELNNPVQIDWDAQGRLGVLCRPQKKGTPQPALADRLLLLEDTDGDGEADRSSVFAEGLNRTSAFAFYRDGVLVDQAGDLWLLSDPNRTGKATERERVLMGFGVAAAAPTPARLLTDPKGAVYWCDAGSHRSRVETGTFLLPEARGMVVRLEPAGGRFEPLLNSGMDEAPGMVPAPWGNVLFADAKALFWHAGPTVYGRPEPLPKKAGWPLLWEKAPAPCTGATILRGGHFPPELQGALLATTSAKPAGIRNAFPREGVPSQCLSSENPDFNPRALASAPDGSLFFADSNGQDGRLYRITAEDHPLPEIPSLAEAKTEQLLDALLAPEEGLRERARHRLGTLPAAPTLEALKSWVNRLNPADPHFERHRLEALWTARWFGVLEMPLLEKVLASTEPEARAQGVRLLCEARPLVPDAMRRLELLATDAHERVRLEVLAAAGSFAGHGTSAAVRLVHRVLLGPLDSSIERVAKETLRQLEPDPARMVLPSEPSVLRFVLDRLSDLELAKAPPAEPVWLAQLGRAGIPPASKQNALRSLAKKHSTSFSTELAGALEHLERDGADPALVPPLLDFLTRLSPEELATGRDAVGKLAAAAGPGPLRRAAHAAWLQSGSPAEIWAELRNEPARQTELVHSLLLVQDASVRAGCQPLLAGVIRSADRTDGALHRAALAALPLTGEQFHSQNLELLSESILSGNLLPEAVQALGQLPSSTLRTARLESLLQTLGVWLNAQTGAARQTTAFAQALQLARFFATAWEEQVRETLEPLRKQTATLFVVRSVCDQSRYDTPRLSVRAGQTFQVLFENTDVRPQNLVLTAPGKGDSILQQAGKMPPAPDPTGRKYVPSSPGIVAATRLLAPGEKETLDIKTPLQPGEYEYLSTAPGQENAPRGVLSVIP